MGRLIIVYLLTKAIGRQIGRIVECDTSGPKLAYIHTATMDGNYKGWTKGLARATSIKGL